MDEFLYKGNIESRKILGESGTLNKSVFDEILEKWSKKKIQDIDHCLEFIRVQLEPVDNTDFFYGWYTVVGPFGIIAYFPEEKEACRYRLEYINRLLNN